MATKPISIPVVQQEAETSNVFVNGLWQQNPVFVQVLGMCPTLAVTNSAINALVMGLATLFVLLMSNTLIASLRHFIPRPVRIATYIVIIATFVTCVDYLIQAASLEIHKALGAFISLIVVNCLILGRAETFASRNPVNKSILDALGMGLGFTLALLSLGIIRELLGQGALFGFRVLPDSFQHWTIMLLPGGGFFTLGLLVIVFNWLQQRQLRKTRNKL